MTASVLLSFNAIAAHGASKEAQFVAEQGSEAHRHLFESNALGLHKKEAFEELYSVAEERQMPNWDGYGADPVSEDAYKVAWRFLDALPAGIPIPSIGAEPDGQVTLEWYRGPSHTISISASPDGDLHYSAVLGPNKAYGTEAFFGDAPTTILDLVRRLNVS